MSRTATKPPIDPATIERLRARWVGGAFCEPFRVPSRSGAAPYEVLRDVDRGTLRCPCMAGVHGRACCHTEAVAALVEAERPAGLAGMRLDDLAAEDRWYQGRAAAGEALTAAERFRWACVVDAWLERKFGPLRAA